MIHANSFAGHDPETFHVPGGTVVAARHWIDRTICAIVVQTVHGDYLSLTHDDYGPVPPEIITELQSTDTTEELYEATNRLGFSQLVFKFIPVNTD